MKNINYDKEILALDGLCTGFYLLFKFYEKHTGTRLRPELNINKKSTWIVKPLLTNI